MRLIVAATRDKLTEDEIGFVVELVMGVDSWPLPTVFPTQLTALFWIVSLDSPGLPTWVWGMAWGTRKRGYRPKSVTP
jgi:hypothetical protein